MIKHYVEFAYPGLFVSETESRKVKSRTTPSNIPKDSFAYRFYCVEEKQSGERTLRSDRFNISGWHYVGGEVLTPEEVAKKYPNEGILLSNIRNNDIKRIVRTRMGTFNELYKEDVVV